MKINKEMRDAISTLINLECVIPGKVREVQVTCGTPGCKCMKTENPKKHTSRQMSYTKDRKTKVLFVKKEDVKTISNMNLKYKEMRDSLAVFAHETTEMIKQYGAEESERLINAYINNINNKRITSKPELQDLRETRISRDKWKEKAKKRSAEIEKKNQKIKQLKESSQRCKKKFFDTRTRADELQKQLNEKKREIALLLKKADNKKNSVK
jgi:hypothetical protein